jgi:hypothetical protein
MTEQTESEPQPAVLDQPSPLIQFIRKVAVVSVAGLVVMYISVSYFCFAFEDFLTSRPALNGDHILSLLELKLDKLADEPDLPPERKAKIIKALTKLSMKYHPYLDALISPSPKEKLAESQIR